MHTYGLVESPNCDNCDGDLIMDARHLLCDCPAFSRQRREAYSDLPYSYSEEILRTHPDRVVRFLRSLGVISDIRIGVEPRN